MDSVGVERAGMEKDLDETNTEIRRLKERIDDAAGSKVPVAELLHVQLRQLEERRVRLEENLKHLGESRPGGLPSTQSGTWSPLVLHESSATPSDDSADLPLTPSFVARALPVRDHASTAEADRQALQKEIAEIVLSKGRDKPAVSRLTECLLMARSRDDVPTLRLLGAAFDGYGNAWRADEARAHAQKIAGAREPKSFQPKGPVPLPPMPSPEDLPDSRDGLTRMQRIVLSTMYALWFRADGPMKKTEALVQELRLNDPALTAHAVEATLVQLTHPWSRRNPLIDVLGAMCRLTPLAEELFVDLDKDVVDFEPGFSFKLPCVLPVPFPLVLAKGTDGFPPHALFDVIAAASYLLQFPQTNPYAITRLIRGPDLPNGGVMSSDSLPGLYTGAAELLTFHAALEIQRDHQSSRARIIISELPWPLEREAVVKELRALELEGVTEISDQSTEAEDRLVVEIEHVAWVRQVRSILRACGSLRHSRQVQLRINEEGEAVAASLLTVLDLFLGHRRSVVRRRLRFELRALQKRAHCIEGLLVALEVLDLVTEVIIDSDNPTESFWGLTHLASPELNTRLSYAKRIPATPERLRELASQWVAQLRTEGPASALEPSYRYTLGFSEEQARAILSTRRLSSLRRDALMTEWAELVREMARLEEPLNDVRALEALMVAELAEQHTRHSGARRTTFDRIP